MVSLRSVEEQLKRTGSTFRMWGRAEVKELCNVLMEGEEIRQCLNGHYEGGFAMLCSTDQRILLVDKKPMFLTLEDVRYDMIAEIQFSHRLVDATVRIFTPTKSLTFTSWNRAHLRKLVMGAQQHVMAMRQYQQNLNNMQVQQGQFNQQLQQQFVPQQQPQPQQAAPQPLFEPSTLMTMPHPQEQAPSDSAYSLSPAFTTPSMSQTPTAQGDTLTPFPGQINPFLRAPLITRHRSGLRRW